MDLKSDSLVVKLYNKFRWLGHQFWNSEREYDTFQRRYYDSEEEYQKKLDTKNGYIVDGSKTDICTIGRRIFILGPLYILFYGICYAAIIYLAFGWNIQTFGLLYTSVGIGYFIGILALILGLVLFLFWCIHKYTNHQSTPIRDALASISESVSNSSLVVVSKSWYASFKERTCVLLNVKGTK